MTTMLNPAELRVRQRHPDRAQASLHGRGDRRQPGAGQGREDDDRRRPAAAAGDQQLLDRPHDDALRRRLPRRLEGDRRLPRARRPRPRLADRHRAEGLRRLERRLHEHRAADVRQRGHARAQRHEDLPVHVRERTQADRPRDGRRHGPADRSAQGPARGPRRAGEAAADDRPADAQDPRERHRRHGAAPVLLRLRGQVLDRPHHRRDDRHREARGAQGRPLRGDPRR